MSSLTGRDGLTAILYARVSTEEQARGGYSMAQQLEALRDHAAREGYEVLEEVADPGQSGASLERPGMDRVRDRVAAGGVSVVLAQDRDRLAREPAYLYLLKQEFAERGTELRSLNDRGDASPEGELTDGILDQLAKYERAKTAERTRRGKLRRAREGKIVAGNRPTFGFEYNAGRDNYVVKPEEMQLVMRIFRMVGVESATLYSVKRTFEREGLPAPGGQRDWAKSFIRDRILDDVYKPHGFEEIRALVAPEVAGRLDPEQSYGIWWFNRKRHTLKQVAEDGPGGRVYRRRTKIVPKPREEWIAVPVPDAGIPGEWVEAARQVLTENGRISKNGGRFWELSGGVLRCAACGWKMKTSTVKSTRSDKPNYYYRCSKQDHYHVEQCPNRKVHRADRVEPRVWGFVSELLGDPDRMRAGLEEMIERENRGMVGDPAEETTVLKKRLAEAEAKRARFQDMAAEGYITFEELGEKLEQVDQSREEARRKLVELERQRGRVAELSRDRDELLEHYAAIVPEALASLESEERHHVYKLMKLDVGIQVDGTLEVSGALGSEPLVCGSDSRWW